MRRASLFYFAVISVMGCADDTPAPAEKQTALMVTIDYARNDTTDHVDTLHITGVVLATQRPFGPFEARGSDKVRPGATVALLFDPSDEGTVMVCAEARDGASTRAAGCGMFRLTPLAVEDGTVHLVTSFTHN